MVDGKEIGAGRGKRLTSSDPTIAMAWENKSNLTFRMVLDSQRQIIVDRDRQLLGDAADPARRRD